MAPEKQTGRKCEDLRPVLMVGETGFEPATPWSRTKCSTRLSHSPLPIPSPELLSGRRKWASCIRAARPSQRPWIIFSSLEFSRGLPITPWGPSHPALPRVTSHFAKGTIRNAACSGCPPTTSHHGVPCLLRSSSSPTTNPSSYPRWFARPVVPASPPSRTPPPSTCWSWRASTGQPSSSWTSTSTRTAATCSPSSSRTRTRATCKVIILTGVEDQFTRHVCFELGADAYEVKPFDHTFMTRVARLAGVKEVSPSLSAPQGRSERMAAA